MSTIILAAAGTFRFVDAQQTSASEPTLDPGSALIIARNLTIRSEVGYVVLDANASANDPRRMLMVYRGVTLTMEQINITGGFTSTGMTTILGAGVFIDSNASLELDRCHVHGNTIWPETGSPVTAGGGMYNTGILRMFDSTVTNNSILNRGGERGGGGGIFNRGELTMERCAIASNRVVAASNHNLWGALGGGLYNWWGAVAQLLDTTVEANSISDDESFSAGGGIINTGELTMVRANITSNRVVSALDSGKVFGGGLYNFWEPGWHSIANLTECNVFNNSIAGKSASSNVSTRVALFGSGGGVFNQNARLGMVNCAIVSNSVISEAVEPGFQVQGGGLLAEGESSVVMMQGTRVERNTAGCTVPNVRCSAFGGGLNVFGGALHALDCTIAANTARAQGIAVPPLGQAEGGGLYLIPLLNSTVVTAIRCNFAGNSAIGPAARGGGLYLEAPTFLQESAVLANTASTPFGVQDPFAFAEGRQIFNGDELTYVMPTPLGRWVGGTVWCASEPVQCRNGPCSAQPCDTQAFEALANNFVATLVAGPTDDDYPPACIIGSYASRDSVVKEHQRQPTCSGLCTSEDPFSTTDSDGAISRTSCLCNEEFYRPKPSERCQACPMDVVNCSGSLGATLETLKLTVNHWRLSAQTTDIRECNTRRQGAALTRCRGGADSSNYCFEGLSGPFCRLCVDKGHYLDEGLQRCVRCPVAGAGALAMPLLIVLAIAAFVALLQQLWLRRRRLNRQELLGLVESSSMRAWLRQNARKEVSAWAEMANAQAMLVRAMAQVGLVGKLKLLLSYYQVILVMPQAFDVPLPPLYEEFMRVFEWLRLDWFSVAAPAACVGGFRLRLALTALGPLVPLALLVIGSALYGIGRAAKEARAAGDGEPVPYRQAAGRGVRRTLPLVLFALFALVPSVCATIFSTFSCQAFGFDDDDDDGEVNLTRSFLYADYAVECSGEDYEALRALATGFVVIWAVGVPALFLALLLSSRSTAVWAAPLWHAVGFLHSEYEPQLYFWELLELTRKLLLTGFVFLMPQQQSTLRIVFAILMSIGYHTLLQAASPYKQRSTFFVATALSLTLQCALLAALLIRMIDEISRRDNLLLAAFEFAGARAHLADIDNVYIVTVIILVFNFGVLVCVGVVIASESRGLATLRVHATGRQPTLTLAEGKRWHLYCSHNWANQTTVATIKQTLIMLLPSVRLFLATDDLASADDIEQQVAAAQALLVVLGSPKYLSSAFSLRELAAAQQRRVPLVRVHEADPTANGASLDTLESAASQLPSSEATAMLFAGEVFPWHRAAPFQQKALALVAEQMLLGSPAYREADVLPLYVKGGLAWARPTFESAVPLYVSAHNPEAADVARELCVAFEEIQLVDTMADTSVLRGGEGASRVRWLLFLSRSCFEGEAGARLEAELTAALQAGVRPPLTLYCSEGCAFREIVERTPSALVHAGLYSGSLALEWLPGHFGTVSTRLVAKALGAHLSVPCEQTRYFLSAFGRWLCVRCHYGCEALLRGPRPRVQSVEGLGSGHLQLTERALRKGSLAGASRDPSSRSAKNSCDSGAGSSLESARA